MAVIMWPIIPRLSYHDPAWREQRQREQQARQEAAHNPPARTRPFVVAGAACDQSAASADDFVADVLMRAAAIMAAKAAKAQDN